MAADGLYTARELRGEWEAAGYPALSEAAFKKYVERGLFPAPRQMEGRRGYWNGRDRQQLLDLGWLIHRKRRSDAAALGLWLHGYDIPAAHSALIRQAERLQELLIGRVLRAQPSDLSEGERDRAYAALQTAVDSSAILPEVTFGLDETSTSFSVEVEAALPERPEMEGVPTSAYAQITYPTAWIAGGSAHDVSYPNPAVPESARIMLFRSIAGRRLAVLAGVFPYARDGAFTLPLGLQLIEQASQAQLDSVRFMLTHQLTGSLEYAESLKATRILGREVGPVQHVRNRSVDFERIMAEHDNSVRHLTGDPALFPVVAYLIAEALWEEYVAAHVASKKVLHTRAGAEVTNYDYPPGIKATSDYGLLAMAIDRWLQEPETRHQQLEALLTLLFVTQPERFGN